MLPYERSLVEKYRNRPFALLGVNYDSDILQARALSQAAGVTWRNWPAGGAEFRMPPFYESVTSLPTILVLDAQGVIRHVNPHGAELERAIESLLREAETGKKG